MCVNKSDDEVKIKMREVEEVKVDCSETCYDVQFRDKGSELKMLRSSLGVKK